MSQPIQITPDVLKYSKVLFTNEGSPFVETKEIMLKSNEFKHPQYGGAAYKIEVTVNPATGKIPKTSLEGVPKELLDQLKDFLEA